MAWDQTKPANNSALVSSEVRANFAALQTALGNPDTTPLTIKQADLAALARFGDAPTFKPGTASTYAATIGGRLDVNATSVANVTTGDTDLITYTLPANVLAVNLQGLRITAWGTFANNGNNKTIKVFFGATSVTVYGPTAGTSAWRIVADIIRTGAATQIMDAAITTSGIGGQAITGAPAETLSGTVVIKLKGLGTATNDIIQLAMVTQVL